MAATRKPNQPILYNGTATPYMALFNSGGMQMCIRDRVLTEKTENIKSWNNFIKWLTDDVDGTRNPIDIKVLMVDYAGKLASIAKDKEDFDRISNVYIDLQNLAEDLHLDVV